MNFDKKKLKSGAYLICLFLTAFLIRMAYAVEDTYFKKESLEIPTRELSVIVGKEGLFPNRLVVFKGEKVRFFLTSTEKGSHCFNIPSHNFYLSPTQNKIAEGEVYFDRSGVFLVNCPNNNMNARIIVLEKVEDKKESERRGRADLPVHVWMPKETPTEWQNPMRGNTAFASQGEDYIDLDRFNEKESDWKNSDDEKNLRLNGRDTLPDSKSNLQIGVGRTLATE